ncbi:hypothetical protein GCM10011609_67700 [Lentzea pudingi]|uniref:Uncharacterized protein n=1 Tax=Lentzea pudingi TaxID=1789439 RepID=A0ABQ2IML6_9PSEU|nr:hypothetical protein [Lentzea pudingi]GGN17335.1 hypothetical protein GCM10011609_67700 [Lentzea pudingi]
MSEQTTVSITVCVGPHASGGLAALAAAHLADALAESSRKERRKDRPTISNKLTGPVHGTVFQIGTVHNKNPPDGR